VYATEWDVTCNSHACPEWNDWSMWNDCSATCGTGTRRRYRTCLGEDDFKCTGESHETDFCNANPCPGSKTIVILCGKTYVSDTTNGTFPVLEHCHNM